MGLDTALSNWKESNATLAYYAEPVTLFPLVLALSGMANFSCEVETFEPHVFTECVETSSDRLREGPEIEA